MKRLLLAFALAIGLAACDSGTCCKTCVDGKACGDSCISQSATCEVGPGCACDG
jgi:hypothetical protein